MGKPTDSHLGRDHVCEEGPKRALTRGLCVVGHGSLRNGGWRQRLASLLPDLEKILRLDGTASKLAPQMLVAPAVRAAPLVTANSRECSTSASRSVQPRAPKPPALKCGGVRFSAVPAFLALVKNGVFEANAMYSARSSSMDNIVDLQPKVPSVLRIRDVIEDRGTATI